MSFVIEQRFIELDKLVLAAAAKGLDPQVQSYFCKLGSVLVCGNLERCVEYLVTDKLAKKSGPQVASFLKSYFKRGTNYDCDEIKELLYRFDKKWGADFEGYIQMNAKIKESISSCYAVRNSVAHGGGQSLGHSALRQYFNASFDLVVQMQVVLQ